jgi:hypothetical protein
MSTFLAFLSTVGDVEADITSLIFITLNPQLVVGRLGGQELPAAERLNPPVSLQGVQPNLV